MVLQAGEWMDYIAINWLVLVQTNSPLVLGLVNLLRGAPNVLLAAAGGVVADRMDRRTLLVWTLVAGLLCTAALAALATADALQLWHIYALLMLRGASQAFNHPARSSIIGDLVPRQDITNAMALHSMTFNATRIVAPALAGFLIGPLGTAFILWVHTASFVVALWTVVAIRDSHRSVAPRESPWGTFTDGLRYIWGQPTVLLLLVLGTLPFVLGQPYMGMLPVFAKDVLRIGSEGLGLLMTASAVGAVIGSLAISGLGDFRRKGLVMVGAVIVFGLGVTAFALTPWPLVAGLLLFFIGACFQVYGTTNAALVLLIVPAEYRGRVLGVYQMDRGFIPLGTFVAGAIAEGMGAPVTVALMGGMLALAAAAVMALSPRIRSLD